MTNTTLLPFEPEAMTPAQLAAVSYLARYTGHTHTLYAYQLRRLFTWAEINDLGQHDDARRSRVLPVRPHRRVDPGQPCCLRPPPKIHTDESRTQDLDLS
jgi:hypothetical protein